MLLFALFASISVVTAEVGVAIGDTVHEGDIPDHILAFFYQPYSAENGCHEGTYLDSEENLCKFCTKGTYTNEENAESCRPCPIGWTTYGMGSSNCNRQICDAGEVYDSVNDWKCIKCRPGTYAPEGETEECLSCPEKYRTRNWGASSVDQCTICAYPYAPNSDGVCDVCPVGKYYSGRAPAPGRVFNPGTCAACRPKYTTKEPGAVGSRACVCAAGYWRRRIARGYGFTVRCEACPEGKTSPVGAMSQDECV